MMATEFFLQPDDYIADPQSGLERTFIEEYLATKGYKPKDLKKLSKKLARQLRVEASVYASNRLAEVETRSRLVNELHGKF